jgi:hypothetical protein
MIRKNTQPHYADSDVSSSQFSFLSKLISSSVNTLFFVTRSLKFLNVVAINQAIAQHATIGKPTLPIIPTTSLIFIYTPNKKP